MSEYVYIATMAEDGQPMCGFVRKYELRNWCRTQETNGWPDGNWINLYGISSSAYTGESRIREYEYRDGDLIDKAR